MKTIGKLIVFLFTLLALTVSAYAANDPGQELADAQGLTPLHIEANNGRKAGVEALLAKGVSINAQDKSGMTPLHHAAFMDRKDVAEVLLSKGANVNARDEGGKTPLHLAAHDGNRGTAELLLIKGAAVNAKDEGGETPLHSAAAEAWDKDKKDIAELLLDKGADVNAMGGSGWTPLHRAAFNNRKDVAEVLLAKGANVNAKSKQGETPLSAALRSAEWNKTKNNVAELLEEVMLKPIRSNSRAAIVQLTAQLKDKPDDTGVRHLILKLASELKPAPAIPEEARKHFVEGTAIVKAAKNPAQQAMAAQSFTEALKIAPWWGDAYYNLGVAQELAEKYDEAEQAFNFYLLSNPSETEKRAVQDRIYGLSAKRKLAGVK